MEYSGIFKIITLVMCMSTFKIISHNTGGLGVCNRNRIHDLLTDNSADILLLQETWLFKNDLCVLSSIHDDYLGHGKSAVPDDEILHGRPYGGLGFVWKKALAACVKPVDIKCNRVDGILVTMADGSTTLILNVYLPVDTRHRTHVSQEYEECIDIIENVLSEYSHDRLVIGGDFNTDFNRNNAQSQYLKHFLETFIQYYKHTFLHSGRCSV